MSAGDHRWIVVGVDGSAGSDAALGFALEEAALRRLPLRIICAWELDALEHAGAAFVPSAELITEAEEHAKDVLARALTTVGQAGSTRIEALAIEGHPARVLVEHARDAHLLVIGTRGHGGLSNLLLGSVSQSVAHHARCPVTIVPVASAADPAGSAD